MSPILLCTYVCNMRTLRVKKRNVKESFQNSIRLLVALLMMAGALSAYAYDAAGTTADRATRIVKPTILTVQSGSNYVRIEPDHLPATIVYMSDDMFAPIPAALMMSDTLQAERLFEDCRMGWKWTIGEEENAAIVEIKAHESALIDVNPYVCQVTYSDTTAMVCKGIEWNGAWIEEDGDYEKVLINAAGCDSVRTLHLKVLKPVDRDTVAEAWDSLFWQNTWYRISGEYPKQMEDAHHCEYTYTLNLAIHTTYRDTTRAEGCEVVTFEKKEYAAEGIYELDTTILPSADRTIRYVQVILGKCPKDTTIYFCAGQNTEHIQYGADGSILRYRQYNYTSPADWNYMEGVILDTEEGRTLVDLNRAEDNLYSYYVAQMTPVKSIVWSFRAADESSYRVVEAEQEPQWFEAGEMALVVRFLCGQAYYGGFSTNTQDLPMNQTETQGRKILMNGQIVILRNGVRYTILGTKID